MVWVEGADQRALTDASEGAIRCSGIASGGLIPYYIFDQNLE